MLLQPGFYRPNETIALMPRHTQKAKAQMPEPGRPIKQEPLMCRKYDVQTATANSFYYRAALPLP